MSKPTVSIICDTYNHESYITKCLDGLIMQETNFDFEVLVHDDASTDDTPNIIRKYTERYPDKIKAIYQRENQYSRGVDFWIVYQFPRVQGSYIAICEGDDCWTDPYKLQKQLDFLEANPAFSIACGGYLSSDASGMTKSHVIKREDKDSFVFNLEEWTEKWYTRTLTVLFRKSFLSEYFLNVQSYKYSRDLHLFYHLLKKGCGVYLSSELGIYNIHNKGIWSTVSFEEKAITNYNCWKELYELNRDKVSKTQYFNSISYRMIYPKNRNLHDNIKLLFEGIALFPSIRGGLKLFVYSFTPNFFVKFFFEKKHSSK